MFGTSDNVCSDGTGGCLKSGDLQPTLGTTDGTGWARANSDAD